MTKPKKIYWDANAWLGLINRDKSRVQMLETFYYAAKRGEVEIWTSVITDVEVYKMKEDLQAPRPLDEQNKIIDDVLHAPFVKPIEVNRMIMGAARELLRAHPALKKPYDAVHLASALRWNVDALHTYDRKNLLALTKKVTCRNGSALEICHPDDDADGTLLAPPPARPSDA